MRTLPIAGALATPAEINALAKRDDVASIYYNAPLRPGAPAGYDNTARVSEFRVSAADPNREGPGRAAEHGDQLLTHGAGTRRPGPQARHRECAGRLHHNRRVAAQRSRHNCRNLYPAARAVFLPHAVRRAN